jgi:lipopolysaccharide transport system permease protein
MSQTCTTGTRSIDAMQTRGDAMELHADVMASHEPITLRKGSRALERATYLRDLLMQLVGRELKLIYKRSVLGIAWAVINPLLQLAVFSIVFSSFLAPREGSYTSFVFAGLLMWTWFSTSLTQAANCIVNNHALVKQPGFPRDILPLVVVSTWFIHLLFALPVLLLFLQLDGTRLTANSGWLPFVLAIQFVFTLGLAYPIASMTVSFRDTQHIVGALLNLLFFLSPIFYSIAKIPACWHWLYMMNPISQLLTAYRSILIYGSPPDLLALSVLLSVSCVLAFVGHTLFSKQSVCFLEEL